MAPREPLDSAGRDKSHKTMRGKWGKRDAKPVALVALSGRLSGPRLVLTVLRADLYILEYLLPVYSVSLTTKKRGGMENGELIASNARAVLWRGACRARVSGDAEAGIPSLAQMRTLHGLSYNTTQGLPGQQVRTFTYCAQSSWKAFERALVSLQLPMLRWYRPGLRDS